MLDRVACERRVFRLALLLTGNERAAASVTGEVVGVRPDLRRLRGTHLDRLTVLRSREAHHSDPETRILEPRIAAVLGALPSQQREAWVFHRVFRIPLREMARAMDCSVTATERHLDLAESTFEREVAVGISDRAANEVRQWILATDVPGFYRRRMEIRRRVRLTLRVVAILLIAAAIITAAVALF